MINMPPKISLRNNDNSHDQYEKEKSKAISIAGADTDECRFFWGN